MLKNGLSHHLQSHWRRTNIYLKLWIGLKCFLGMCLVGGVATFCHTPVIIGTLAASCATIFTKPFPVKTYGPKVIFGNLIGAILGLLVIRYTDAGIFFIACAVLFTMLIMEFTHLMHLPACSATASIILMHAPTTCILSITIGSIALVLAAGVFNAIAACVFK